MPEHTEERAVLRRQAEVEATEAPALSLYLDMRPQATGQRPAVRSGLVVLKDRLHQANWPGILTHERFVRGDCIARVADGRVELSVRKEQPASED